MTGLSIEGRHLLFVGGKGGVGKTTIAAALALHGAGSGRRVLLVSTDPAHSLGDLFGQRIGNRKRELISGLWGLELDPEGEVDRYLEEVGDTMRAFVRPAMYTEIERQIALARHSPGATEAALMDRMARLMGKAGSDFDQVIFDTAPTGHTLRLLALPEIMAAWMDGLLRSRDRSDSFGRALGRLAGRKWRTGRGGAGTGDGGRAAERDPGVGGVTARKGDELSWFDQVEEETRDEQSGRIREILLSRRRNFSRARRHLLDPETTAFVMVLIPEKLPILETDKALAILAEHRVPVAGLVVNRVLPEVPLGEFLESRRHQEHEYLARIDRLFPGFPQVRVPLLRRDVQGIESLRKVVTHLRRGADPS